MDYISRFRARADFDAGVVWWVYGFYTERVDAEGRVCFIHQSACDPDDTNKSWKVDPDTVGRFTGLWDANGVDVYEGDIVEKLDKYSCARGVVRFGRIPMDDSYRNHVGFYIAWADDGMNEWSEWLRCDIGFWIEAPGACVVGNIYDNADLLPDGWEG